MGIIDGGHFYKINHSIAYYSTKVIQKNGTEIHFLEHEIIRITV